MRFTVRHHRCRGFNLVEVMLSLAIISIVASIAAPRYSRSQIGFRLDRAAQRIAADFDYASRLARVSSTEIEIKFQKGDDPDKSYYWFETVEDPDHPGTPYTIYLRDEPYRVILDEAPHNVVFRIDGGPKNSSVLVVRIGDETRAVFVNDETREVTVN